MEMVTTEVDGMLLILNSHVVLCINLINHYLQFYDILEQHSVERHSDYYADVLNSTTTYDELIQVKKITRLIYDQVSTTSKVFL